MEDGHEHDHLNRLEKSRACRTAAALPELLRQLKLAGYKVVHLVPKNQLTTLPKYDEMFEHRENLSSSAQPGHVAPPTPQRKRVHVRASTGRQHAYPQKRHPNDGYNRRQLATKLYKAVSAVSQSSPRYARASSLMSSLVGLLPRNKRVVRVPDGEARTHPTRRLTRGAASLRRGLPAIAKLPSIAARYRGFRAIDWKSTLGCKSH